ncbi:MAG: hypothetical protein WC343_12450 [Bacilli bacterium]|jgi:hypothetical protein
MKNCIAGHTTPTDWLKRISEANANIYLLHDKIADEQRLSEAVQFFTSGDVEHAYPITRQELETLGLATKPLDPRVRESLVDIINSSMIEGVYHI